MVCEHSRYRTVMAYTVEPRHYEVLGTIRIVVSGFLLFRVKGTRKCEEQGPAGLPCGRVLFYPTL